MISTEMYAADWIITLFSNIIPITQMAVFYNNFLDQGWIYFYKFGITLLKEIKEQTLKETELQAILSKIKFKTPIMEQTSEIK